MLVIKCQAGFNKSINIVTSYRHPIYQAHTLKEDYEHIEGIVKTLLEFRQNFFILGDFNLRNTYINKLNDILENLNFNSISEDAHQKSMC